MRRSSMTLGWGCLMGLRLERGRIKLRTNHSELLRDPMEIRLCVTLDPWTTGGEATLARQGAILD